MKKRIFLSILFIFALFFIFTLKKEKINTGKDVSLKEAVAFSKTWYSLPEVIFFDNNSLKFSLPPYFIEGNIFGAILQNEEEKKEIQEYVVAEGDTFFSISQKFGISVDTILFANGLNKNSILKPGQKLIILPVDGILHQVKEGDTLNEIANKYQAKVEEIIAFNELEGENNIYIGDILVIPGGKMPKPKSNNSNSSSKNIVIYPSNTLSSGYFICPVAGGCRITQSLHWYNAVDFSNGKCGEPIVAAASGTVIKAKYGWNGGGGNLVKILHSNGVITMYGHLQVIFVSPGEEVLQGQIIGTMGSTGRSTGCHLHFDVFGAKNPFAK